MTPEKTSNELEKDWICKICELEAEYNDCGKKLCVKHWCKQKGLPHGKSKHVRK